MSRATENHKHIRRRLEPLRIEVTTVSTTASRVNGPRVCLSVVEAHGVRYRGRTIFDSGMDWSCGSKRPYLANRFVEECVRLSQLRHPNLATFYGIAIDRPSLTLVTDLPAASLDECLCRYETIPEFLKTSILLDAARGLLYLHKQNPAITHAGVSTRSIYLASSMRAMVGDVGVAGALGAGAANDVVNGKMPPKIFVSILEKGTKCTDTQVDVPAFGNVIVHTVQHQQWLHPPGYTAVSPHLRAMPIHHPLFPLAYQCLQGKLDTHNKQASRPDMDHVVQCLQHAAKNNPLPFHNTLELFQAFVAIEQNAKQFSNHPTTSLCKCNIAVQELPLQDKSSGAPVHDKSPDQFNTPPPTTCGTGSSNQSSTSSSPTKSTSESHSSPHHDNSLLNALKGHSSFRSKSTGQVRPPPPKPPQRSSSFRKKSSDQVTTTQDSLRRTNSLRVKSSVTDKVATQETLQRTGSFRMKSSDKVMTRPQDPLQRPGAFKRIESDQVTTQTQNSPQSTSDCGKTNTQESHQRVGKKLPPPLEPTSPHTTPVIKTVGVFSSGSPKQNSLLLPSKFTPFTHKEDVKQPFQTQKSPLHTMVPVMQPTSTPADLSEFERLLARQRMKVESDELNKTEALLQPQLRYTNGEVVHRSEGRRAATDMDLPKKKAPKPPRRTSSFKSSQKPTKYKGDCNGAAEVTFGQYFNISSEFGKQDDQPSTSPSTGQTRPTSAVH